MIMDPQSALDFFICALDDGDEEGATEAAQNYQTWLDKGGFEAMPSLQMTAEAWKSLTKMWQVLHEGE
jgi:hypothetical protein